MSLLPELAVIFLEQITIRMAAIVPAVVSGDLKVVHEETHALKSSAASYGALMLSTVLADMDEAAQIGDASTVESLLPKAEELAQKSSQQLEAFLNELSSHTDGDPSKSETLN